MFYERFVELCSQHNVTPSRAAIEAGLSKSTVTKWKNEPTARPTGKVIQALTRYFGISVAELLGEGAPDASHTRPTTEDIKFALFGGTEEITDAMYQEVLDFASYLKHREAEKNRR